MRKDNIDEEELLTILKDVEIETPSIDFSKKLTDLIVENHQKKQQTESTFEKYFGKFILFILICSNVLFLYDLKIISMEPLIFASMIAFAIGVWVLIAFMNRFVNPSFE